MEESMKRRLGFTEFVPDASPLFFHVWTKAENELIGEFLLFSKSVEARQGEIGYVLNKRFQGKGYAIEAAQAVMEIGFSAFNLHRIEAKCSAANHGSWRLMQKLGMRREAHFVENGIFKGEWDELMIYAILQREWRALHP
jgi:RimJ/RimL family protein N-acetyltransferase